MDIQEVWEPNNKKQNGWAFRAEQVEKLGANAKEPGLSSIRTAHPDIPHSTPSPRYKPLDGVSPSVFRCFVAMGVERSTEVTECRIAS